MSEPSGPDHVPIEDQPETQAAIVGDTIASGLPGPAGADEVDPDTPIFQEPGEPPARRT